MCTFRIFLKSGQYFDVVADKISCVRNKVTGEFLGLSYEGCIAGIPLYIDCASVEAVVQLNLADIEEDNT